jgi:hypothetical protein
MPIGNGGPGKKEAATARKFGSARLNQRRVEPIRFSGPSEGNEKGFRGRATRKPFLVIGGM